MEIERGAGGKRFHNRLGPSPHAGADNREVCRFWKQGTCNRKPCNFRHSELPEYDTFSAAGPAKRAHNGSAAGGNVWRNPNSRTSNGAGPASRWGKAPAGGPAKPTDRPCKFFLSGTCHYGDKCRYLHAWCISDSFLLLTPLEGHQQVVTGIALPSGSDKLFTCSKDATVRLWDCQTGQCSGVVNLGHEVGCMISEGPWLFIGMFDSVKVWNTQSSIELSLPGPSGQVHALVVGNEMLLAGVQDGLILAWRFVVASNSFEPVTSLSGHGAAVVSLVVGGTRLYSGSVDHTIRVWELTTLQCVQVLQDHTDVVMSVLCWDQFLLSSSLDKTIKVWAATESGSLEVTYTHEEAHGVLALCGVHDAQAKPVLICSVNDNCVRLYDLPSFGERGRIFSREEVRALQIGPGGLFFTGDGTGELKVWRWLTDGTSTR